MSAKLETPKISEASQKLKDVFDKVVAVDSKTGVATLPETAYVDNLPEGLTKDIVEQVQDYNTTFATASAYSIGEAGNKAFKKHSSLDHVTAEIPTVGGDSFGFDFRRSKEVNAAPGSAEKKTIHGVMSIKHTMHSIGKRGDVGRVRDFLQAQATAQAGK